MERASEKISEFIVENIDKSMTPEEIMAFAELTKALAVLEETRAFVKGVNLRR